MKYSSRHVPWWRGGVVYQIYPRSFQDTSYNGVGDLEGVIQRLGYLEDLGVDALWLSPIFSSPMLDGGYDITDYYAVDSLFGTLETFDRLVAEAHSRGLRIILDFVPNHTSSSHPWFAESRSSRENPKRDWYVWRDPSPGGGPPNNWLSSFGGSVWTLDEKTNQYYLHSFLAGQPDLNWRNTAVQEEFFRIMRFWLGRKIDGFRIDALTHLAEDQAFSDNPPNPKFVPSLDQPPEALTHTRTQALPETFGILRRFTEVCAEFGGAFLVSEVHCDRSSASSFAELMAFYRACGPAAPHTPFNFFLLNLPWNAVEIRSFVEKYEKELGAYWPNYVLGNHDVSRLATRLGINIARTAAMLLLTLRGTVFMYYGDELGMEDVPIIRETPDPRGKLTPSRDPARTPMQWDASPYAGFSTTPPWLPVHENFARVNVEIERRGLSSLLNVYKKLLSLRKTHSALRSGEYHSLVSNTHEVFAFMRTDGEDRLFIVLNFSSNDLERIALSERFDRTELLLSTYLDRPEGALIDLKNVSLRPHEGLLMKV